MPKRSPTIVDVATLAGVSTATVSRSVNGGVVSKKAQRKVNEAIKMLGYRRNTVARGLVTGRTGVIGVLVPDVAGPLYAQMARGVEDVLEENGMNFMLMTDNRNPAQEHASTELLLERQVDGLIIIGSLMQGTTLERLLDNGPPVVLMQRENVTRDLFCTVDLDNNGGVVAALEHLLTLGHRRIAHVSGVRRDGEVRLTSYRQVLSRAGLPEVVICEDGTEEGGYRAGLELSKHPDITAVFCANDRTALGLYHAVKSRGLTIPDDLSVVGFDDLFWSAYLDPPLTTIRQPGRQMGRVAAGQVLAALGGAPRTETVLIPAVLVQRSSVQDLRASDKGGE